MTALFERIRAAVAENRFAVGVHAANKLDERNIEEWQIITGIAECWLLSERPHDKPNPSVEVQQILPDGTPVKVVWSWLPYHCAAKLVTVHFLDR